jgi:hypothetical protein
MSTVKMNIVKMSTVKNRMYLSPSYKILFLNYESI